MIVIISLLLILSFIILIVGLISPKIIRMKSRKRVMTYGIPIVFLLFFAGLITAPELTPEQKAQVEQNKLEKDQSKIDKQEVKAGKEEEKDQQETQKKKPKPEKKDNVHQNKNASKDKPDKKESELTPATKTTDDSEKEDKNSNEKPTNKKNSTSKKGTVSEKSRNAVYEIFKFSDDPIDETVVNVDFDKNDKSLSVTVKGKEGWTDKSMGAGFYEDSTAAYRELYKDDRIDEAWITITFPMQDEYGNVDDEEVMATWMSRETMDKIDWEKFNYLNLLDAVDGKRVYPQFVQ